MGTFKQIFDPVGLTRGAPITPSNMLKANAGMVYGTMNPAGVALSGYNPVTKPVPYGTPDPQAPFDPNAPGSIMTMGNQSNGPFINPLTRMRAGYTGAPTPGNPYGTPIQQPNTQQPQPVMSGQLGDTQNNLRMSIGRLLGGRS